MWVAGACLETLADGCNKILPEQVLTDSQVASLKSMGFDVRDTVRQIVVAKIGALRSQIRDGSAVRMDTGINCLIRPSCSRGTSLFGGERMMNRNSLRKPGVTRSIPAMIYLRVVDSKTIFILFSADRDKVGKKIDERACGGKVVHFEYKKHAPREEGSSGDF